VTRFEEGTKKARTGFAVMDKIRQLQIARRGGIAVHEKGTAHEFTREEARAAGRKGGVAVSKKPGHMSRIGRLGGFACGGIPRRAVKKTAEQPEG